MKKLLVGEKPTIRETAVKFQDREIVIEVGPESTTYRLKGLGKAGSSYVLRHVEAIPAIKFISQSKGQVG